MLARMEASLLMKCIITEKQSNQINTLYKYIYMMKQRKGAHDSQIVRAKENLMLSYGGPSQDLSL